MAKIEVAYSLEIEEYVGAIEANELWIEGKLKDRRLFVQEKIVMQELRAKIWIHMPLTEK